MRLQRFLTSGTLTYAKGRNAASLSAFKFQVSTEILSLSAKTFPAPPPTTLSQISAEQVDLLLCVYLFVVFCFLCKTKRCYLYTVTYFVLFVTLVFMEFVRWLELLMGFTLYKSDINIIITCIIIINIVYRCLL